jgi:hypothetical protein
MPERLDMLRADAIAVAHHAVHRWLIEDILQLFDRHIDDVDLVDKGVVVFGEPLKDPTMTSCRHAAILGSICAPATRPG